MYRLSIRGSNVYFVRSGSSWAVIDTAWAGCERVIKDAAEALFGANSRPAVILLTHAHPDHGGSALQLARIWRRPVYVHPDELPLATGTLAMFEQYPAGPLDRWLLLPLMRALPARVVAAMIARISLQGVARALGPRAGVPGLTDWTCVPTPGHTPGHAAFFRASDRVLIAGDALLTVNLNSVWDLLMRKQTVAGPPYIATWNWRAARESVAAPARLEPRVLAPGHGTPMSDPDTAGAVRAFADRFSHGLPPREQRATACGTLVVPPRPWVGVLAGALAALAAYAGVYRPWQLRWGATDQEVQLPMPGDELVPHPTFNATRAITIYARPQEIWPWLLQIGAGRAGWYTYAWLERQRSAARIVPAFQRLAVGDRVPTNAKVTHGPWM